MKIEAELAKDEESNLENTQTIDSEIDQQFELSFNHTRAMNERSQELKKRRN